MFGVTLVSIGTFLQEISTVIGKKAVEKRLESVYTMGFLSTLWSVVLYLFLIVAVRQEFIFSLASLPTFGTRLFLEIIQADLYMRALVKAERSTFGLARTLTIPLLLGVDFFLGYQLSRTQIIGMGVIAITLLAVFASRDIKKAGIGLVVLTALNAVITLSLFKYDITHFNSVETEQLLVSAAVLVYFFFAAYFRSKENPFLFLRKPIFLIQSISDGAGGIIQSFAYAFAPASVILAAGRSSAVLWSVLSGNRYFREQHLLLKVGLLFVTIAGLILLTR